MFPAECVCMLRLTFTERATLIEDYATCRAIMVLVCSYLVYAAAIVQKRVHICYTVQPVERYIRLSSAPGYGRY